ncbi:MAG TPA: hypothetical protein VGB37_00545 [Candidatus Lokiarchaeia archaeon]
MVEILLIIIIIEIALADYFLFYKLPSEKQKEILRKVVPIKSKVIEWEPEKKEEEIASEKVMEEIGLGKK